MGTDLQEVFDAFFVKIPSVDFTGKESQVIQFLKSSIAKCYRRVYDKLDYSYDDVLKEGYFLDIISQPTIELISMYMVIDYFSQKFSIVSGRKQHIGTQAFNKIPNLKEEFDVIKQSVEYWDKKLENFLNDFPDYSEER